MTTSSTPMRGIPTTTPPVETSHPSPFECSIDAWDDWVRATIQQGDDLFNPQSSSKDGYWYYTNAARHALAHLQPELSPEDRDRVARLLDARQRARIAVIILAAFVQEEEDDSPNYQQAAWILRKCFQSFLDDTKEDLGSSSPVESIPPPSPRNDDASSSSFAALQWPPPSRSRNAPVAAATRQPTLPVRNTSPLAAPDLAPCPAAPAKSLTRSSTDRSTPRWSFPAWLVLSPLRRWVQSPLLYQWGLATLAHGLFRERPMPRASSVLEE
jgi:hypothetical protein